MDMGRRQGEEEEEEEEERQRILAVLSTYYGIDDCSQLLRLSSGLINTTYKVTTARRPRSSYIFQKINSSVFIEPRKIDENLRALSEWLRTSSPSDSPSDTDRFAFPLPTFCGTASTTDCRNSTLVCQGGCFYRVFPYIDNSYTITKVVCEAQCFAAAKSFGFQTYMFKDFDIRTLHTTIEDFHNLIVIFNKYSTILETGNSDRIAECGDIIALMENFSYIVSRYKDFISSPFTKLRVTHHDTKISNVLFNCQTHDVAAVIDLDTTFPGYFLSDVGDMIRSYVSNCDEDDDNYDSICVDKSRILAIKSGYLTFMNNLLTDFEKSHFYFSGELLIYMQAIRFFSDYLSNDQYYSIKYTKHNLVRTRNQLTLLQRYVKIVKEL